MKNPLKLKWCLVVGIWLTAIGVTYWNSLKIDAVRLAREKTEQVRKEIIFMSQNNKSIDEVHRSHDALFFPVPSVAFGLIRVEQQMRSLASTYGLEEFELQKTVNSAAGDQVSCQLSLQGGLEQVFQFLTAMTDYPYLPIRRFHVQVSPNDARTKTEMEFTFQYRILPLVEDQASPLQAFGQHPELEGDAL